MVWVWPTELPVIGRLEKILTVPLVAPGFAAAALPVGAAGAAAVGAALLAGLAAGGALVCWAHAVRLNSSAMPATSGAARHAVRLMGDNLLMARRASGALYAEQIAGLDCAGGV